MKKKTEICTLIFISMLLMFANGCKKNDKKNNSTPTPTITDSTVYFVKYDFSDTSYCFTSKNPSSSYGTENAICRIGFPNDYYSGIDIELESPYGVNLIYSDIKALEGTFIPLHYSNSDNNKIAARITTLTPGPFYSYQVDSVNQKGKFYIEKVTQLSSYTQNHKVLEVKGSFSCNMWPDTVTIRNGTFLIKFVLWPEY